MSLHFTPAGASNPGSGRQFPHIADLQAWASLEFAHLTEYSSIDTLLNTSAQCNQQVATDVSFKRPDRGYVEWLKSDHILKLIKRHREFPYLASQKKEKYLKCCKDHERQQPMSLELKKIIEENNLRLGTMPSQRGKQNDVPLSTAPDPNRRPPSEGSLEAQRAFSSRPLSSSSVSQTSSQNGSASDASTSSKTTTSTGLVDPLLARFSKLRSSTTLKAPKVPSKVQSESMTTLKAPIPYPETDDSFRYPMVPPKASEDETDNLHQLSHVSSAPDRPAGPRQMPGKTSGPPVPPKHPVKPPLNTSLPRAPSPVYSPARNIAAPASIEPPRTSARSSGQTATKSQPPNTASYQLPPQNYTARKSSSTVTSSNSSERPSLPKMGSIKPSDLHHYSRQGYRILLVDIRPRGRFDEGHIGFSSIVCIDPFDVNFGTSYETLIDSLPFASSAEIDCLQRIDEYELIVLYDDSTPDDSFLEGSPVRSTSPNLRKVYDTLTIYNYVKKLKKHPVVLAGGVDGWVDFLGPQSLVSSNTSGVPRSERPPKPRPRMQRRISVADEGSSREIRRRRMEMYTPLRPDEEREWKEKLQREQSAPADISQLFDESKAEEEVQVLHNYDDFFRRFPSVEQESMVVPKPAPPPRVPIPLPQAPSRPAPTVSRPSYSGVTDREITQPQQSRTPFIQPPLYTSRFIAQSLKVPRTGLKNFGATCYMNSTIQCLQGTIPLSRFFLDDTWRNFVQQNTRGTKGLLPQVYANLIRALWQDKDDVVRPITMRQFCGRLNESWRSEDQQDAQEFFGWLIDCLHEDLNSRHMYPPSKALTEKEEAVRERMPLSRSSRIEWDRYSRREYSFISTLFAGQHASRVTCQSCGATSTTYEAFYMLSLEIPDSKNRRDIRDCLSNYCGQEQLPDGWRCPKCKTSRPATKQIRITRMPQILVINFKRFDFHLSKSNKIKTVIDFPLYGLDMKPYMWDTYTPPKEGEGLDHAITPPFTYDAYAVLRHHGDVVRSGHYTAVVKDPARDMWRLYNDTQVVDNHNPKRLPDSDAYLVFYERSRAR